MWVQPKDLCAAFAGDRNRIQGLMHHVAYTAVGTYSHATASDEYQKVRHMGILFECMETLVISALCSESLLKVNRYFQMYMYNTLDYMIKGESKLYIERAPVAAS
jgi:hypothetical protein